MASVRYTRACVGNVHSPATTRTHAALTGRRRSAPLRTGPRVPSSQDGAKQRLTTSVSDTGRESPRRKLKRRGKTRRLSLLATLRLSCRKMPRYRDTMDVCVVLGKHGRRSYGPVPVNKYCSSPAACSAGKGSRARRAL